jgi:hypothetical protein
LKFEREVEREWNMFGIEEMRIECKRELKKEECMNYIDEEKENINRLDDGEVFVDGR